MLNDAQHQWPQPDIKVESHPDFPLLSPPLLPLPSSSLSSTRRRSHPTSPTRAHPYPRSRLQNSNNMATTPAYWASPRSNTRRASDGNQQLVYDHSPYSIYPDTSDEQHHRLSPSSGSSGTSSLTGAPSQYPTPFLDPSSSATYYARDSPESLSPPSPFSAPEFNDGFPPNYASTTSYPQHESDVRLLRKRLRELEQANRRAMEQIKVLESRLASGQRLASPSIPTNPTFHASWKARTEARIRQFCSLNRAGNALCAWHDSRRERRVHPPRMAPAGYLNCGCTYEEALFEESLARHHVGSYLPGETQRYNYRDGDFERDPTSGDWLPGEGPSMWEHNAPNPRRDRR
ncbi:hypothetical protein MIND_01372600 [Mycena indigotica]|uniref:Uncharacterized protein n=1 Tax=Mycena indigotica TaxID=2126181 RepID=A0A8H6S0B2_9AGAR|nr:uncharacterized protein MIND_01372600 [Mycena indigotica]KAF7289973.1 hypothetical protein MIND_01372600 [Mycena indigotica]